MKIKLINNSLNIIVVFLSIISLKANADNKIIAKNGDTLLKLSKQYGVPLKELLYKNNFNDANKIIAGETIVIPTRKNNRNGLKYIVKKGDTLYSISMRYNVKIKDIISINNLETDSILKPNQIILLPERSFAKVDNRKKNIKLASKKIFYHQVSNGETLSDIALIHDIPKEEIISLNNLGDYTEINLNTKLKIRKNTSIQWLKYQAIKINWSDWRYLAGSYITKAKNKDNRSFFLAVNCDKRALNNTLKNSNWANWYSPKIDFEFKLISDFCDQSFNL